MRPEEESGKTHARARVVAGASVKV